MSQKKTMPLCAAATATKPYTDVQTRWSVEMEQEEEDAAESHRSLREDHDRALQVRGQ